MSNYCHPFILLYLLSLLNFFQLILSFWIRLLVAYYTSFGRKNQLITFWPITPFGQLHPLNQHGSEKFCPGDSVLGQPMGGCQVRCLLLHILSYLSVYSLLQLCGEYTDPHSSPVAIHFMLYKHLTFS